MPVSPTPQQAVLQRAREASIARSEYQIDRAFRPDHGEEPVYYPGAYDERAREPVSFFQDLYWATLRAKDAPPRAVERLGRHRERSEKWLQMRARYGPDGRRGELEEQRAVATATLGGLIPPAYLLDLTAKAPRNARVYADQCNHTPLPPTGMNVIIPRITTATAVGVQATENTTVTTQDPVETDLTVPVRTLSGYLPTSRQSLERGSYSDKVLFEDLLARSAALLDLQCITGSGSSGQFLGVLNTAGIVTVAEATATMVRIYTASINLISQVNTLLGGLGYTVDKCFMHPRRWGWMLSQNDSTGRPLIASTGPAANSMGAVDNTPGGPVGYVGLWAGVPTYTDANIPTNLGAGTNEDRIVFQASQVVHLFERTGDPVTLSFEQQAGTSLQVQLIAFSYAAFTAGRQPSASAVLTGAALATPAFT